MRYALFARGLGVAAAIALMAVPGAEAASGVAPGAPGASALWTAGNKDGFGTSTTLGSKVWFTLGGGELTEVYYPNLGTPAVRDLQFVVTDGKSWVERESEDTNHTLTLTDPRSLSYQQVNTDPAGRFRITKTYTTDPSRSALLMRVHFESLTNEPLRLYVLYDPSLSGNGDDDSGSTVGAALVTSDAKAASALVAAPAFTKTSSGYLGTSDGWTDLRSDYSMDWNYTSAPNGNVVQTGRLALTGKAGSQDATLALGFGGSASDALNGANASLAAGFTRQPSSRTSPGGTITSRAARARRAWPVTRSSTTSRSWFSPPRRTRPTAGAFIASPTMAWVWGQIPGYNGPYHLVWSRDLYEMATAELAAGDRAAAGRGLDYLWTRQQKPDGCLPQNSNLDGSPHWGGLQLDEVADPILLSWQLGRTDAGTWSHVQRAAALHPRQRSRDPGAVGERDRLLAREHRRRDRRSRLCRADRAGQRRERRRRPLPLDGGRLARTAGALDRDHQRTAVLLPVLPPTQRRRQTRTPARPTRSPTAVRRSISAPSWTRASSSSSGSASSAPTTRPCSRRCPWSTASSASTLPADSSGTGTTTTATARPLTAGRSAPTTGSGVCGRSSPASAASTSSPRPSSPVTSPRGRAAAMKRLDAIANTANDGFMLPEQVWDDNPPSGTAGRLPGTGTGSATPLGWTHAQFIRLAWSIDAGRPVERPSVVSCRYGGPCPGAP